MVYLALIQNVLYGYIYIYMTHQTQIMHNGEFHPSISCPYSNMPSTFFAILCIQHLWNTFFFVWCDWMIRSGRSPPQWKFKPPADLCKLHLAWGCYKLGSLFSLWCQQNRGCQEVQGLGNVSRQGRGSPLSWFCAHGTDREKCGTCTFL